ncbi:hypothetical protein CHISP_2126 [Chitinispirillum alkaliphilum]|nr:hypothetical protein CHISP_2126 [Chitinispirillum alkaliphilum]
MESNKRFKTEFITETVDPKVIIIKFKGELDSSSINTISELIDKSIQQGKNFIIAEMSSVKILCSAALGEFMGARKRLLESGGNLVFAALNRDLKNKLTFMGANKVFTFHNDIKSASAAYDWEFNKKTEEIKLTFPSFLKLVPPVRQLVSRIARRKGYGTRDSFRIETIVDEVCNNAIEHGKKGSGNDVKFNFTISKDKVDINVINVSDPEKVESLKTLLKPENNTLHTGADERRGRGLALIRMLSNDVSVNFQDNGTDIRVIKIREE